MKMLLSLAVWFALWEIVGQARLSSIVPPFSAVIEAGLEIAPTENVADPDAAARFVASVRTVVPNSGW